MVRWETESERRENLLYTKTKMKYDLLLDVTQYGRAREKCSVCTRTQAQTYENTQVHDSNEGNRTWTMWNWGKHLHSALVIWHRWTRCCLQSQWWSSQERTEWVAGGSQLESVECCYLSVSNMNCTQAETFRHANAHQQHRIIWCPSWRCFISCIHVKIYNSVII